MAAQTPIEASLREILDDYRQLIMALDTPKDAPQGFATKLRQLKHHLHELQFADLPDLEVPLQLVQMVDEERNPDQFLISAVRLLDWEWRQHKSGSESLSELTATVQQLLHQHEKVPAPAIADGNLSASMKDEEPLQ